MIAAFGKTCLPEPKARRGAVEKSKEPQMVLFGGIGGQLDDRCRLLEHLPATVQDEVVVRGDLAKDDT